MSNSSTMLVMDDPSAITPGAIIFRILTLIALLLDLPPLIWHIRGRNLAASTLIFYIVLDNFMNFVNTLLWPTYDISSWWPGYGLCDVEVKLMTGTWVGVVSCLLCILRDLARVLDTERTVLSISDRERMKRFIIDCLLCFGAPIYMMVAHYVVQSNRYYIFAVVGCNAGFDPSWPRVVLIFIWPPILCLVNVYYAVLVMIRIIHYRSTFSAILASSSSSTSTKSRFLRLFCMALTMSVFIFPVSCYILYRNSLDILVPYSWSRVHGPEFMEIMMVPAFGAISFDRWVQIAAGTLVFVFFGMGKDAMKSYKKGLLMIGLGRFFPSLKSKGSREASYLGSQGSGASQKRLLPRKKLWNPFSGKSGSSLPTHSPKSLLSSSIGTPNTAQMGHPTNNAEHVGRMSESTAPSTPYSSEKYLGMDNPHKASWLQRCLVLMRVSGTVHQPSSGTRGMQV